MWATVTEMAPTGNLPIDGDPFLTVQQVVPDYDNHRCDVMVWIDATPVDISYRVTLYIASGL
ncbi:hypothetical protein A5641_26150 [Mycobacterium sp. 1554424.7]|nr:hypothetical protein A5641_26150 [Mycobacterium sp. 1554424.7]